MSLYLKIILSIFALAYLVSPMDIIPEILIPYLGWIDDTLVLGTIIYMLKYNRLPDFSFFKRKLFKQTKKSQFKENNQQSNYSQSRQQARSSRDQAYTGSPKSPYEILNIPENASKEQIQSAYKSAIKKYHPDKLSHLGEEFASLAKEKFLEIQNAYDQLMNK